MKEKNLQHKGSKGKKALKKKGIYKTSNKTKTELKRLESFWVHSTTHKFMTS